MEQNDALRTCCHSTFGCMGGRGVDGPYKICLVHACELQEDREPPEGVATWGEHEQLLDLERNGYTILDEDGNKMDINGRADAAVAAAARQVVGGLLFSPDDIAERKPNVVKHPVQRVDGKDGAEGDGRGQHFANGYVLCVAAAVVSFADVHKRKPKGEEVCNSHMLHTC